jgi:sRNA-binding protein
MEEPWTVSRGPVEANEFDLKKAEAISQLLVRPIALLPSKLGDPIKPFAVGIWTDLRALMKPDVAVTALRRATSAYTHSKRYVFASAQPDSMRHDVDGAAISDVSDEDRLAAQQRFVSLKKSRAEETAATTTKIAPKLNSPENAVPKAAAKVEPPADEPSRADRIRAGLLSRSRPSASSTK